MRTILLFVIALAFLTGCGIEKGGGPTAPSAVPTVKPPATQDAILWQIPGGETCCAY